MVNVTDGLGTTADIDDVNKDIDIIRNAYHFRNVSG